RRNECGCVPPNHGLHPTRPAPADQFLPAPSSPRLLCPTGRPFCLPCLQAPAGPRHPATLHRRSSLRSAVLNGGESPAPACTVKPDGRREDDLCPGQRVEIAFLQCRSDLAIQTSAARKKVDS